MDVTVLIPTVGESRKEMLARAIASVEAQTVPVELVVEEDTEFTGSFRPGGASTTRNRALERVQTEWVTFLDDDDTLYPDHVEHCLGCARENDADLVYPWFDGPNSSGILFAPKDGKPVTPEGLEFGEEQRECLMRDAEWYGGKDLWNFVPITVLVKTELVRKVGGFPICGTDEWPHPNCEDHGLWIKLLREGAKFAHLPERTWMYHVHGKHLSHA
jgi:glycosyltransferase involved in cell wall biosynthesis